VLLPDDEGTRQDPAQRPQETPNEPDTIIGFVYQGRASPKVRWRDPGARRRRGLMDCIAHVTHKGFATQLPRATHFGKAQRN
jgi:hypothetical protein